MAKSEYCIFFSGASDAEKSRLARKLGDSLAQIEGVEVAIKRERPDSQDPGTILSIVLGAPSVVLAARGLANWLVRNNQTSVRIQRPDGTIIIRNMKSSDVPKAIEALKDALSS